MFDVHATHSRSLDELIDAMLPRPFRDGQPHRVLALGDAYRSLLAEAGRRVEEQAAATFRQLQADLRSNAEGAFIRVRMSLSPEWLPAFQRLEPRAAMQRLVEAAERAAARGLPRHPGALVARAVGPRADPGADLCLSPRLRLHRGTEYFPRLHPDDVRLAIGRAVQSVADRAGLIGRVRSTHWADGLDLRIQVMLDRSRPGQQHQLDRESLMRAMQRELA